MLTFFAGLAFAATLGSANHGSNSVLPSTACLAVAKAIAVDLQPFTDAVAGKPVVVSVVAGIPPLWTSLTTNTDLVPAEIGSNHEIIVHSAFCEMSPMYKAAVIAHEIGHVIDFEGDTFPTLSRFHNNVFTPWRDRPMEKMANGYGKEIIRLRGGDPNIIDFLGPDAD